jgi:hypothetical protein
MRYKLNGVTLLGRKVARHGGELHKDARTESSQKRELPEHPINIASLHGTKSTVHNSYC